MSLRLRAADPADPADAERAAWAADTAADGIFTAMLGARAQSIVAQASLGKGHSLSLEHVVIAEFDGQPCGWMAAMPAEEAVDPGNLLARLAGVRALRMAAVYLAGRQLFRAMDTHDPGDYHIQSIAVDPQHRGRGIGHALLERAETDARAIGARGLSLDVDIANDGAERLYRSLGFELVRTTGPARLLGGVSVRRLRKPLR